MRMEELSDSRYEKGTDSVERYLLGLVNDYFKDGTVAMNSSREFIIKKAVKRMKEELDFEDIGVLSITLPDGRVLTGPVTITIDDLNGEPKITLKRSAFNVDFGDQANTACEGNDPRLYDARKPLPHKHDVDDIIGLSGTLSTLTGSIKRLNGFAHDHKNQNILDRITYSGSKNSIDLGSVDASIQKAQQLSADIKKLIQDYKSAVPAVAQGILDAVDETSDKLDDVKDAITANNSSCLAQAKKYAEDEFNKVTSQFNAATGGGGYVVKDKLDNVLKNSLALVGTMNISISSLSSASPITESLDANIATALTGNNQFEFRIKQKNTSGENVFMPTPYMVIDNSQLAGQIVPGYFTDANGNIQISIVYQPFVTGVSPSFNGLYVTLDVYSKQDVTL